MTNPRRVVVCTSALKPDHVLLEKALNGQAVLLIGQGSCQGTVAAMGICSHDYEDGEEAVGGAADVGTGVVDPPMGLDAPADELWTRRGRRPPEAEEKET